MKIRPAAVLDLTFLPLGRDVSLWRFPLGQTTPEPGGILHDTAATTPYLVDC